MKIVFRQCLAAPCSGLTEAWRRWSASTVSSTVLSLCAAGRKVAGLAQGPVCLVRRKTQMLAAHRYTSFILVAVLLVTLLSAPGHAAMGFVQRQGDNLVLDGRPWKMIGYNNYNLTSLPGGYTCGGNLDDATLNRLLDRVRTQAGANTVRTWFFQSYTQGQNKWAAFDRVLRAAAARGMKVVPVLVNHWSACEPGSSTKNVSFYRAGYKQAGYGYQMSFRDYARTVAQRYADDPTIAFWQLVNEPGTNQVDGACDEAVGASALRAFADDMVGVIKAVDANHLVSLGTAGGGGCGTSYTNYSYVHAGAVDLCSYHDYGPPEAAMPGDEWNGLAFRVEQAAALGKPLFIGEAGIDKALGLQQRASYFDAKIRAAFSNGIDGYLIWHGTADTGPHDAYDVHNGDPTDNVLRRWSAALTPASGKLRFDFEEGTLQGWKRDWGRVRVSNTRHRAFHGKRALALRLPGRRGYPSVRTRRKLASLLPGAEVTYRIFSPVARRLAAAPYVTDGDWRQHFAPGTALQPGWNTVTFTVPKVTGIQELGLQVNNSNGWKGTVVVDAISW